jgi:hypothetical protein
LLTHISILPTIGGEAAYRLEVDRAEEDQVTGGWGRETGYRRSSVAAARRFEPDAVAVFDELVEVLQQIYLNFQLVLPVDIVYR